MNISDKGLALLGELEGLRLTPYDDQTGKPISKWRQGATIGYGHLISYSDWDKYKNGITLTEAKELLRNDVSNFEKAVRSIKMRLPQDQFDALVIFAYNIGVGAFLRSSVYGILNGTKKGDLELRWKAWNKSQGKVMQGLINRRVKEYSLFSTGIY